MNQSSWKDALRYSFPFSCSRRAKKCPDTWSIWDRFFPMQPYWGRNPSLYASGAADIRLAFGFGKKMIELLVGRDLTVAHRKGGNESGAVGGGAEAAASHEIIIHHIVIYHMFFRKICFCRFFFILLHSYHLGNSVGR